ncbi:MAG: hypothetical protein HFF08_00175 [Oscillospiraceae bacterium]|nr:hypothetical protein [Oscillospiraceae bacterium]
MQKTAARNSSSKSGVFSRIWLVSFLTGATVGTLAARYSASAIPDAAAELCVLAGDRLSAFSLLSSTAIFLVMLILLSQLPGGSILISLLTAMKAMCMAFVLGLFYQFRLLMGLDTAMFRLTVHMALLLPACCALASHCCAVRAGEGKALPLVLPFLYLLMVALLEFLSWGTGVI